MVKPPISPTPPMPPELRAEALRVLLALRSGAPYLGSTDALDLVFKIGLPPRVSETKTPGHLLIGMTRLGEDDVAALDLADAEDVALANACLLVEVEVRERAYAALERLLVLAQWSDGPLDERLRALPLPRFAVAAAYLYELGWVNIRS